MSGGFAGWVAGPYGTLALTGCALAAGVALGWTWAVLPRGVSRRERRELADRAAVRAARQFRRMRVPELHHERRTSTAAFLEPTPYGMVMLAADPVPPAVAHEAWVAHCEEAEEVGNDWRGDLDRFLAELRGGQP